MLYPLLESFSGNAHINKVSLWNEVDVIFEAIFPGKIFLTMLTLTWFLNWCEFYSLARLLVSTKHL